MFAAPVLEAAGLRVHYEAPDAGAARGALVEVPAIADAVEARLGVRPPEPLDVFIAANDAAFDATVARLAAGARPPRWALAVALPGARAVVVRGARLAALTWNDLRPTLAHELAHLALMRAAPGGRLPRWLNEGLAMWASGRRLSPEERTAVERLARRRDLPALEDLAASFPPHAEEAHAAYLVSLSFVETLEAWYGAGAVAALVGRLEAGAPLEAAFERTFQAPLPGFDLAWRAELERRYSLARDLWQHFSLWTLAALLTLLAFVRYWFRRRKLLRAMDEAANIDT